MPNWCYNKLLINGNSDDINKFYLENRSYDNLEEKQELDFHKSVPQPEDLYTGDLGINEMHTTNNWYTWNLSNLGTKWNVQDAEYSKDDDNNIIYLFDTA
jgi:hypothetical protein